MVYVFAQKMNDRTGAVLKMKDYSDHLQELYNAGTTSCGDFEYEFCCTIGIDNAQESAFSIFPNPTSNAVTITTASTTGNVSVYNMQGQLVLKKAINASITTLDVSHLCQGVYQLQYSNGARQQQAKVVVH